MSGVLGPTGVPNDIARQVMALAAHRVRPIHREVGVYVQVDEFAGRATSDSNWVIANQNMAAALLAKGNHYRFIFANGAGHCDHAARNEVMPDGLVWLWRGYQATN